MRSTRLAAALLAALALGWLIGAAARAAKTETAARVMLVLDASGSMWGRIGDRSKIEIARDSIADLMARWDPDMELGLIAYGHRVKGDCGDIETLIPVGSTTPESIVDAVGALKPKGKTPLSEAVRRAAAALRSSEEAATVILVSDGLETCKADPCAVAGELEAAGVGFTVHVIGFDLEEEEQQALRCVADNTGGLFLAAGDAGSLKEALGKAVETTKAEVKQAKAPPPPAKDEGVRFTALYGEGGPAVTDGTSWTVFKAADGDAGERKRVSYSYDARPVFELAPGRYVAQVTVGSAAGEVDFEVAPGAAKSIEVVLGAGVAAAVARRTEDGEPVADGLSWSVLRGETEASGKRQRVTYSYDARPTFTLPAGRYVLQGKVGAATGETAFEVEAGERTEVGLVLASGILAAEAIAAEGGEALSGKLSWNVLRPEKDISGKRKRVTYSYDSRPNWELPAGKYVVRVTRGSASAEQEVAVGPNRRTEATLVLNAGVLAARTAGGKTSWKVLTFEKDITGKRKQVTYSYDAQHSWMLPAGRYIVRATQGDAAGEAEVEIRAGQRTEVEIAVE